MKKTTQASKRNVQCALQERQVKQFIVKPIVRQIKQAGEKGLKQGRIILKRLKVAHDSLEIMARELARQNKKKH